MNDAANLDGGAAALRPRAFVAFAGGGAKALAHVGALRALESRVEVAGYAGTSAGAIVAALAAAGLTANDMVHPTSNSTVVDDVHRVVPSIEKLTDLFGPGGWDRIKLFRTLEERLARLAWPAWLWFSATLLLITLALISTAFVGVGAGWVGALVMLMVWLAAATVGAAAVTSLAPGLARLVTLRNALDAYLIDRVRASGDQRPVLMGDFDGREGRPLLKIVAADITRARMTLFSYDRSPGVRVADAVAASVCIPFIFEPWRIERTRYVDGGVVSNFPAWPFDEERTLDGDAVTIGFEIGKPPDARAPRRGRPRPARRQTTPPWPIAVLQTALTGTAELSTRAVGRSELLTLHPDLDLLDFDISSEEVRNEIAAVEGDTAADLELRFTTYPLTYQAACAQVRDEVAKALLTSLDLQGRVRCAVAMRTRGFLHSLQTLYGVGYNADPDADLVLPDASSLAGRAWSSNEVQFERELLARRVELDRPEDASLRRRLAPDLAWSLRVPMSTRAGRRFLVVMVDGSATLADNVETTREFEALADRVKTVFQLIVDQFEDTAPDG